MNHTLELISWGGLLLVSGAWLGYLMAPRRAKCPVCATTKTQKTVDRLNREFDAQIAAIKREQQEDPWFAIGFEYGMGKAYFAHPAFYAQPAFQYGYLEAQKYKKPNDPVATPV